MRRVLLLILGFVCCLTLATGLDSRFQSFKSNSQTGASVLALALSDSRQMLATHLFLKADAYFHNGTYPSIFEAARNEESHMTQRGGAGKEAEKDHEHEEDEHHHDTDKADQPHDWIERFGKHFVLNTHQHLENDSTREILPWLKLAADLDPKQPSFYTTASYWLRNKLNNPNEAERFLRQGLRANPDSYEILFELGTVRNMEKDPPAARQLWNLALRKWDDQKKAGLKPDELTRMEILGQLAKSEEDDALYEKAIFHLEQMKAVSPNPDAVAKLIERVKEKTKKQQP